MSRIDEVKKSRGRPKGSIALDKLKEASREEEMIDPTEVLKEDIEELDEETKDAVSSLIEEDEEFEKEYKSITGVPKIGNYYAFKVVDKEGNARILISHMDFNDTFNMKKDYVVTPYGNSEGFSCPVVLKFVDVITDPETEEPIGIFQVISTPSMVRRGIDPRKLGESLSREDIDDIEEQHLRHSALQYKMQRDVWKADAETYRSEYKNIVENRMEISEEIASTAIQMLVKAMMAAEDMVEELKRKEMPIWKRYMWELIIVAGAAVAIMVFFLL